MDFGKVEKFISTLLKTKLSSTIFYHDYFHTMDVMNATVEIAKAENITNEDEITFLKTAALFHDSGFINAYHEHEEEGCRLAKEHLPVFGYNDDQISKICGLIMVTKMPQNPHNLLERILCDADLDYLGRADYEKTAQKLFDEWKERGKVQTKKEWIELQIKFLESHHYWTPSALARRQKQKEANLKKLREMVYD